MSTVLQHDTDYKTREAVEAELHWSPQVHEDSQVGVSVREGIVTLSGEVSSYAEKNAAGKAALRTSGVTAIANDLKIRHTSKIDSDGRLAQDARDALRLNVVIPRDAVEVEVRNHIVYLTGMVDWEYQRKAAKRTVRVLDGTHGVVNDILLPPRVSSSETHAKIRNALVRNATIDADRIQVNVTGTTVTLTGTVSSFTEIEAGRPVGLVVTARDGCSQPAPGATVTRSGIVASCLERERGRRESAEPDMQAWRRLGRHDGARKGGTMAIRVFLLDDHEVVRSGLEHLLTSAGDIEVVGSVGSAAAALARIPALKPDVAVLDARLQDGSGIDVCREIRSSHPATRAIILTSFDDDEALFAAILAGAAGYVLKQVSGQDLVSAVRQVAAGGSLLDPAVITRVMTRIREGEPEEPEELKRLTQQERRILELVSEGLTNREIGERMFLAEKTVKNYMSSVLAKLGFERRTQAAVFASRMLGDSKDSS